MSVDDLYPLTPLQQGLLFDALRDDSYVEQLAGRLHGLDVDRFRGAWATVSAAHPALRTAFSWRSSDRPVQAVVPDVVIPVLESHQRDIAAVARAERARGFALDRPPLTRVVLVDAGDGTHHFVWTFHHLLLDGWSLGLVLSDLEAAYLGQPLAASPPFRDFVAWSARQPFPAEFWRRELAGLTAPTPLPFGGTSGARAEHRTFRGECAAGLAEAVHARARQLRITLSSIVQCAWALVLARHGGLDDVLFGATVSGRSGDLPGVERMVGLLTNTLPVRVRVQADADVGAWLQAQHARLARLRGIEHSALADVQRQAEIRSPTRLFETLLAFENHPGADLSQRRIAGLPTHGLRIEESSSVPLTLAVVARDDRMLIGIDHDESVLTSTEAAALAGHFELALRGLASGAAQRVGDVSLLDATAYDSLVVRGNDTGRALPDVRVQDLVAAQIEQTPEAIAVRHADEALSYRDLDRRSNRVAQRLAARGAGPGSLVAVCVERSLDLVVALLGVLKAGAAYVPVDPGHPRVRREELFAAADHVLGAADVAGASDDRPVAASTARDPAYVIYTSGSTGLPKGVVVEQRNVVARVLDRSLIDLAPGEAFLATAPAIFDVSAIEIWATLVQGGTLVLCPDDELTAAGIGRLIRRWSVAAMWLSAGVFDVVVREDLAALTGVRRVIAGGEALPLAATQAFVAASGPGVLLNGYGPTEATIFSVTALLDEEAIADGHVPIGRPIENTRVYVLDPRLNPVPPGVVGELHLGGAGIARGYFGQAGLTAGRFVPDPFAAGARMYRTGDLVLFRPDGTIDFVGRRDRQVKVRGHRVELGEIEAALASLEGIGAARVELRDGRLVAYVVPGKGAVPDGAASIEQLARRLPGYMLPAAVVLVERWPLTANGKLDFAALPAPDMVTETEAQQPPATALEHELATIWTEILGQGAVGLRSNFFDLGGDSISAMRVIARVKKVLAVELTVRDVLAASTLGELAGTVDRRLREALAR